MHALARHESPTPDRQATVLHAVDVPDAGLGRGLTAWDVARFSAGLTVGFLFAAMASASGGGAIVAGQLALAAVAAVTALAAGMRTRALNRATHTEAERL